MRQPLPADLYAERLVLGSILLDDTVYVQVAGTLSPDDFDLEKHRRIFRRMGELYTRGERIDRVTVADELTKFNELNSCDGLSYLVSLDDGLPQIVNLESYVRIVKDKATLRRIVFASQRIMNRAMLGGEEPGAILGAGAEALLSLHDGRRVATSWMASDLVPELLNTAAERKRHWEETGKAWMGIPSGISHLDEILDGFNPGRLYLLAGGPGLGKTTLSWQIAVDACVRGVPAVYVSYEVSARSLVLKGICSRAGINPRRIERGNAHQQEQDKFRKAAVELAPAFSRMGIIEGTMTLAPAEVRAKVQEIMRRHNTPDCLVFFDYLQCAAQSQGFSDLRTNVTALTGHLRDLARRVGCPVLALSSQNRTGRDTDELTSLKESGDLEYAADAVMFLRSAEQRTAIDPARAIDLTVKKSRYGPEGKVELVFRPDIGVFREQSKAAAMM